jgi:hypothetical protein
MQVVVEVVDMMVLLLQSVVVAGLAAVVEAELMEQKIQAVELVEVAQMTVLEQEVQVALE